MLPKDNAYFEGIRVMDRLVNPLVEEALSVSKDET
jgi:hypothetical protein